MAKACFEKAGDLSALMLLLMAMRDRDGLKLLAGKAGVSSLFLFLFNVLKSFVEEKGQNNLAFAILLQLGDSIACVDLLTKIQRAPEAALFARTYAPGYIFLFYFFQHTHTSTFSFSSPAHIIFIHSSQAPKAVQAWKSELTSKKRTKIAAIIADPSSNPELFEEGWEEVLAREESHGTGTS